MTQLSGVTRNDFQPSVPGTRWHAATLIDDGPSVSLQTKLQEFVLMRAVVEELLAAGGFLSVAFNGNNVRRVPGAHDVEVLALPATAESRKTRYRPPIYARA
jgi:hypothetical protein